MVDSNYYSRIFQWIKEEFQAVRKVEDDRNPGPTIEFQNAGRNMAISFDNDHPHRCIIVKQINIDPNHRKALASLDEALRTQLKIDFAYEFSSYGILYSSKYDKNNVLLNVQFTTPYFNDKIEKNGFIDKVSKVHNAGFRVIAFINKELN